MGSEDSQNIGILDRAYQRLGWRWLLVYPLSIWAGGGLSWLLLIACFARMRQLTGDQVLEVVGWTVLLWIAGTAVSMTAVAYLCRSIRRWERGTETPAEAWRAVATLPFAFVKVHYPIVFLFVAPMGLLIAASVDTLTWQLVGIYAIACCGVWLYSLAFGIFETPIFTRPVLRSIARTIEGPPPTTPGMLLTKRLLFVVPGLGVATAMVGSGVGMTPGQDLGRALTHLAIATVLSAAAAIPTTMLLAKSVRDPIEDLLDGTQRIQAGDYRTPVPELTTDEFGQLSRSFNEAMAGLTERQQLSRENLRLLDEVRASRARIVAASDASRRRVERNLHDGAQQRLVAVALDLSILQDMASTMTPEEVNSAIGQASDDVKQALAELRELARGLHPAILSTDGLAPALNQLAARARLSVAVHATDRRFEQEVETAAYFVAAEALANVAKYAHATQATVSAEVNNGQLVISVSDDGIGGATLGSGTGLSGLADRVAALEGRLTLRSPVGRGTTVTAEIPVDGNEAIYRDAHELKGGLQWSRGY